MRKNAEIDTLDFVLIFIPSIIAVIVIAVISLTFAGLLSKITQVDAAVINGLLTVSGVIFAFQSSYFGKPTKKLHKFLFTAIFVVEIILLGLSGISYVRDISESGHPLTYTLFAAFGSLIYNIAITGFFVLFDLFPHRVEEKPQTTTPIPTVQSEPKKFKEINDNEILTLARFVDNNHNVLFRNFDIFSGAWGITLIILVVIFLFLFVFLIVGGVILNALPVLEEIVTSLSFLAVFFAFFSLLTQVGESNITESRFKRALGMKKFEENEKPILKALIKLRSKNPEFDLEQVCAIQEGIIKREKLLEKLYE